MPYKFDQPPIRGFAINNIPGFWLKNGEVAKDLYVAFTAKSADAVRACYKAAIDAGAISNKEPSLRPEWRADYFAANIDLGEILALDQRQQVFSRCLGAGRYRKEQPASTDRP